MIIWLHTFNPHVHVVQLKYSVLFIQMLNVVNGHDLFIKSSLDVTVTDE